MLDSVSKRIEREEKVGQLMYKYIGNVNVFRIERIRILIREHTFHYN